jgi:hypothetical protein
MRGGRATFVGDGLKIWLAALGRLGGAIKGGGFLSIAEEGTDDGVFSIADEGKEGVRSAESSEIDIPRPSLSVGVR